MMKLDLLQTSLKYRLITDYSQEIIIFFNRFGKIVECNQLAIDLLGYGEDIYKISISDIFRKAVKTVNNELVINNKYRDKLGETVAYRKNQTCFAVKLRITVNSDKKNYLGACLGIDMTSKSAIIHELRQTKNELKLSNQMKNQFVANISHELRTPVNGIKGLVENLMETELTPKQLETVNIIHRCCANMNSIINDLLDYTKIANHKLNLEQRTFNLRKCIENIVAINIIKISEKGLKLFVNIADDIPHSVIGDELRLTQIINNLFSNAIKFTSIGHIVLEVVKTEQTEREIELFFMFMDTGIGISLEDKDKLFQSFSQVDGSITRRFGGTGLGLSISKLLVEAMQGTIKVESEKNKGSNFSFTVRLRLPKSSEIEAALLNTTNTEQVIIDEILNMKTTEEPTEIDYVGRILESANVSPVVDRSYFINTEPENQHTSEKMVKEINNVLDRLMICIEMGSWMKADEFTSFIRKILPEDMKELKNKAMRLVLSVRKEDHDHSLMLLEEMRGMINEVTIWKM
ncbi:MAG: sensor signal transduction histidine kinase [Herbinix sp.]|nr:sensor signal transduction histidine kinase [Herbinix sp.]